MRRNNNLEIQKLKYGLDDKDIKKIDLFFNKLNNKIDLPIVFKSQLINDYLKAFEYYEDKGLKIDEIIELLNLKDLGNFYLKNDKKYLPLDNAAIVYPLGMRQSEMPIFRLAAQLKQVVNPILLQLALDITIKRFPYFVATVKNGFFWHYLETNNNPILIEEEDDIPCKPISRLSRTYRSFRVLYYKKRVAIEFFHVLTDGTGGLIFLRTLLREYFRLNQIDIPIEKGVLNINGKVNDKELINEFKNAKGKGNFNTFVDKKSLQLKGKRTKLPTTKIIHFEMNSNSLRKISKKYNGTVTAYLTAIMFLAAKDSINKKEGIFNIQIPVNMRKYNHSKTLRNYSMYFNASLDLKDVNNKYELVENIGKQIKEKGSLNNLKQMMETTGNLINSLAFVPLFLKNTLMKILYGYFSNSIIGLTISNLGIIDMPIELSKQIDKINFLLVPGAPNRAMTTLATINNKTVFTIIKNSDDDTFEKNIYELLKEDGLKIEIEGSPNYEY